MWLFGDLGYIRPCCLVLYAYCKTRMAAAMWSSVGFVYVASLWAGYDRSGLVVSAKCLMMPIMELNCVSCGLFGAECVMYGNCLVESGVVILGLEGM